MKPTRTWILIADSGEARIVENTGPGKGLHQLKGKSFKAAPVSNHADQEGRTFNSSSGARHKMEPHHGQNAKTKEYIDTIISSLVKSHSEKEFDQLIVCAAPETLGTIRQELPDHLKTEMIAEISKDLVKVQTDDLSFYFEDVLAI